MVFFHISLLFCLLAPALRAQPGTNLDSLLQTLDRLPENQKKLKRLNLLALRLSGKNAQQALELANQALSLAQQLKEPRQEAIAYNARAVAWRVTGAYQQSLKDFREALRINRDYELGTGMAQTLNGIGALYMLTEDYERAYNHFSQAYQVWQRNKNEGGAAVSLSNMGNARQKMEDWEEARRLLQRAIRMEEDNDNLFSASYSIQSLGEIAHTQAKFEEAERYFQRALQVRKERGNLFTIIETSLALVKMYLDAGQTEKAEAPLSEAETLLQKQVGASKLYLDALRLRAEYLNQQGKYPEATRYYRRYAREKDSLFSQQKEQQFQQLRAQYQFERTERENDLLRKEKALREQELYTQRTRFWMVSGVLAIVSVLSMALYHLYQVKQKNNATLRKLNHDLRVQREEITSQRERLQEANTEITQINANLEQEVAKRTRELKQSHEELEFYLYHSAHDLRRPITSIRGLVHIAELTVTDEKATELFQRVDKTAARMLTMIQKLNMLAEINRLSSITYERIHFDGLIADILDEYTSDLEDRNLTPVIEIAPVLTFYSDLLLLHLALKNLIENAIFFTEKSNARFYIFVRYGSKREVIIEVKDEGVGIPERFQSRVFDLYFRATQRSTGNGIGLYLAQQAVQKLGGQLQLESAPNQGTTVTVRLPIQVG